MAKIKGFFIKIWQWLKDHAPTRRRIIQVYSALLFNANIKGFFKPNEIIYTGNTKVMCVPGLNCYSCPGAVGACPLGSLQNALLLHSKPTIMYILGILVLFGMFLGRTICGFLCPMGLFQELLHKIRSPKLKKSKVTRVLSYFKYVLLALLIIIPLLYKGIPFFCKYICPAGTFEGGIGILSEAANSDFFAMLDYLFTWKFALLVIFIVACVFIFRFFCRFICPLGAIYGFFNKIALLGIKLDKDECIDCGKCIDACPMDIKKVGDHECIACGKCVDVCPVNAISWKGSKFIFKNKEVKNPVVDSPIDIAKLKNVPANTEAENRQVTAENTSTSQEVKTAINKPQKPKYSRQNKLWLKITAPIVATVVLVSALVYYNFILKPDPMPSGSSVVQVGDEVPSFSLELYNVPQATLTATPTGVSHSFTAKFDGDLKIQISANNVKAFNGDEEVSSLVVNKGDVVNLTFKADIDTEFTVYFISYFDTTKLNGKVTVINFWQETCDPCVAEIPHFEELYDFYNGQINMIAINDDDDYTRRRIQAFIDARGWGDYDMMFGRCLPDDVFNAFKVLGGKNAYPITVVIDTNGKVSNITQGGLSYDELKLIVETAMVS